MMLFCRQKKATSIIEYALLMTIIIAAFLVTQKYIVRGFAGRWKQVGDTFSYGKQYDPQKTAECSWYSNPTNATAGTWYSQQCFDQNYDINYNNDVTKCLNHCSGSARNLGDCGGASPCLCRTILIWTICDSGCCYNQCKERCVDTSTSRTVNACPTSAGLPCN